MSNVQRFKQRLDGRNERERRARQRRYRQFARRELWWLRAPEDRLLRIKFKSGVLRRFTSGPRRTKAILSMAQP